MFYKDISYETFTGETVTDRFYFHYTQEEIVKKSMIGSETLEGALNRLSRERNNEKIYEIVSGIVQGAVGRPSEDGRKFIKTPEILADFVDTNAYSDFMMDMMFGDDPTVAVAEFVNGVIPDKSKKNIQGGKITPEMVKNYQPGQSQILPPPHTSATTA